MDSIITQPTRFFHCSYANRFGDGKTNEKRFNWDPFFGGWIQHLMHIYVDFEGRYYYHTLKQITCRFQNDTHHNKWDEQFHEPHGN